MTTNLSDLLLVTSSRLARLDNLDEVFAELLEVISEVVNADRSTVFLNDSKSNELYSRIAQGNLKHEIRILNNEGIAGHVFTSGEDVIVHDAENDPRILKKVGIDLQYETKNMLCVPIRNPKNQIIGVVEALNKKKGRFTKKDLETLKAIVFYSSHIMQTHQFIESAAIEQKEKMELLNLVSEMSSEIKISALLQKVMSEVTRMLDADRSTLFLHDEKNNQLWSQVAQGAGVTEIRFPSHLGIAGAVFTSGEAINIPYAYADLRFNPDFDKKTGFFTRSILCVPIIDQSGKTIGVAQVLNKRTGVFTDDDEFRLKAFGAKIASALHNADLFAKEQNLKNYNNSMLESMTNGVITLNEEEIVVTCNNAGAKILGMSSKDIIGKKIDTIFYDESAWVLDKLHAVRTTGEIEILMDSEIRFSGEVHSVNLTLMALVDLHQKNIGSMIMIEDISNEKRMKSTMSRYIDPSIANQLLSSGGDIMGGQSLPATVLFSDIRGFTTISEKLGPQATVSMLNEYFELMVDCITKEGGMLDKFIGDAIMAAFGIPVGHDDDEDRAVRASISMIKKLNEWNIIRSAEGKLPIHIGIGLNTDTVVSGNIGSKKRMDYTIIGDGVNLAARLESACKQYAAKILISEFTYSRLKGTYRTREVDFVVVKGKTEPVAIYEVLDYHDKESFPNLMDTINQFRDGIDKYRHARWPEAITAFENTLKLNPSDRLSEIYIERCKHLKENPPSDWQGVWVMDEK
jgi:adenylate cyclase